MGTFEFIVKMPCMSIHTEDMALAWWIDEFSCCLACSAAALCYFIVIYSRRNGKKTTRVEIVF